MAKKSSLLTASLFAFLLIVATALIIAAPPPCAEGDQAQTCQNNYAAQSTCAGGRWQTTLTPPPTGKTCFEGGFIDASCTTDSQTCLNSYTLLFQDCVDGEIQPRKQVCGNHEYCLEGRCRPKPLTCYNGVCDPNEDLVNCPADCGTLSSWDKYYLSVPDNIRKEYGSCLPDTVFDCSDPVFQEALDAIDAKYSPKTPKEFIDATTNYVHNLITYDLWGGNQQCNEESRYFLQNALHPPYYGYKPSGNCVDFSATAVSLLLKKGIAARQVSVCLTHDYSAWNCQPYAFAGFKEEIVPPSPLGHINGLAAGEDSQPLGHALLQAYVDGGWRNVDPTMGSSVSRLCLGYSEPLSIGGGVSTPDEVCYVPLGDYLKCEKY